MKYVKVCPRCGRKNEEFADACASDGEFLGMVPATPFEEDPLPDEVTADTFSGAPADASDADGIVPVLYVEVQKSGATFDVRKDAVAGQWHPSNDAEIQIRDVVGVKYVHRRHCQFRFHDGQWHVFVIEHGDLTNPTFINNQRLAPGQSVAVKNGDRLTLSTVTLMVHLI